MVFAAQALLIDEFYALEPRPPLPPIHILVIELGRGGYEGSHDNHDPKPDHKPEYIHGAEPRLRVFVALTHHNGVSVHVEHTVILFEEIVAQRVFGAHLDVERAFVQFVVAVV